LNPDPLVSQTRFPGFLFLQPFKKAAGKKGKSFFLLQVFFFSRGFSFSKRKGSLEPAALPDYAMTP